MHTQPIGQVSPARGRYLLGADAFLYSGVLYLVVVFLIIGGLQDTWPEWINMVLVVATAVVVAVLAWRAHGRPLGKGHWVSLIIGTLIVGSIGFAIGLGVVYLLNFIPDPIPGEEPWLVVAIVVAGDTGALISPVVAAVRTLRIKGTPKALARLRLGATAIILAVVVRSLIIGGEAIDIIMLLTLLGIPVVCGVLVADQYDEWRTRRSTRGTAPAGVHLP